MRWKARTQKQYLVRTSRRCGHCGLHLQSTATNELRAATSSRRSFRQRIASVHATLPLQHRRQAPRKPNTPLPALGHTSQLQLQSDCAAVTHLRDSPIPNFGSSSSSCCKLLGASSWHSNNAHGYWHYHAASAKHSRNESARGCWRRAAPVTSLNVAAPHERHESQQAPD